MFADEFGGEAGLGYGTFLILLITGMLLVWQAEPTQRQTMYSELVSARRNTRILNLEQVKF